MKRTKAIVLEKSGLHHTLLTANGEFIKVYLPKEALIGEEIEVQDHIKTGFFQRVGLEKARLPRWRVSSSIAAVLIFALIFTFQWNLMAHPQAVAAVSLDINPRLELTLDNQSRVLEVIPANEDAERLINSLAIKGQDVQRAISDIVREATRQNFLTSEQDWVIIGISPLAGENSTVITTLNESDIEGTIIRETENMGITSKVTTFELTSEERSKAVTEGLTVGEYGLYQMAKRAGIEVNLDTLKNTVERRNLLESETIQAKIKEKDTDKEKGADKQKYKDKQKQKDKDKSEDKNEPKIKDPIPAFIPLPSENLNKHNDSNRDNRENNINNGNSYEGNNKDNKPMEDIKQGIDTEDQKDYQDSKN